ncbi:MAG: aminotransferase class I/II-fold pyridoxal phosphate-dependent enzyme, partial [Acidimicrobiales bacterium]
MTPRVSLRPDLSALTGYHSPQVPAEVRLNTNESPLPPPDGWRKELEAAVGRMEFHRYPDRHARALRSGLAELHEVGEDEIFCANGSNEVLQCLFLAFGGAGRRALVFEPTYALHRHIAGITATEVVAGCRTEDFRIEPGEADRLVTERQPDLTLLCSPNNPTGRVEPNEVVRQIVASAPGLVVVDEAYGQFAHCSALALRGDPAVDAAALAVVRTFSKTWAMAASRLGYLVAEPEVVAGCDAVALPYH